MTTNDIVVGLDESAASTAALRWAAEQAELTGRRLRAVYAWSLPSADELSGAPLREVSAADARARATRWLDDALGTGQPTTQPLLAVVEGQPGPALVEASRAAGLLVVGTHEHTGLRRLVSGSVSHYCISHAQVPVVAVPASPTVYDGAEPADALPEPRREAMSGPGPLL